MAVTTDFLEEWDIPRKALKRKRSFASTVPSYHNSCILGLVIGTRLTIVNNKYLPVAS